MTPTPDDLAVPPTDQEVADLLRSLGNSDLVDPDHSIIRRLAFDRDRLRKHGGDLAAQLERLTFESPANQNARLKAEVKELRAKIALLESEWPAVIRQSDQLIAKVERLRTALVGTIRPAGPDTPLTVDPQD